MSEEQQTRPKLWKRIIVVGVCVGVGFALMASLIVGVAFWYESRPKPPRPWDTAAITAEFDVVDTEGENDQIVFRYTLQNNTDFDYSPLDTSLKLMGQLERQKSLSNSPEGFPKIDSVYIPARQRVRYSIHTIYPYDKEKLKADASTDERTAWRKKLGIFIKEDMGNLNGFVIFDDTDRYQINFKKGW